MVDDYLSAASSANNCLASCNDLRAFSRNMCSSSSRFASPVFSAAAEPCSASAPLSSSASYDKNAIHSILCTEKHDNYTGWCQKSWTCTLNISCGWILNIICAVIHGVINKHAFRNKQLLNENTHRFSVAELLQLSANCFYAPANDPVSSCDDHMELYIFTYWYVFHGCLV